MNKKNKIKELIESISKDELKQSINTLGANLSVNNLNRNQILNFVNSSIANDCLEIDKIKEAAKEVEEKHIKLL